MMTDNPTPRILLIGGQPRSGTTMLCSLCNLHPAMVVSSELRVFDQIDVTYGQHISRLRKNWWQFPYFPVVRRCPSTILRNAALVPRYAAHLLPYRRQTIGIEDIRRALHRLFPNAQVVGDKFPPYVWKFPDLAGIERLHRMVIYRDPRDVVQSTLHMVRTEWRSRDFARNLDTAEKIATKWARSMQLVRNHPEGLFVIRYEELVSSPWAVLEPLGRWLGVDPTGFRHDFVNTSSVGRFRQALSAEQIEAVVRAAGSLMAEFGYE